MNNAVIVGIAGASGSGKSVFAKSIISKIGKKNITLIQEDAYYKDLSKIPLHARSKLNFDHPDAFDHALLIKNLKSLKSHLSIKQPIYNFKTHTREKTSIQISATKVIIVEGILVLHDTKLVDLMDIKLFFDVDPDICFIRRLKRDLTERGRDIDSVIKQYSETVKPMYFQYVLPSKRHAHLIIPHGGKNQMALEIILSKIRSYL